MGARFSRQHRAEVPSGDNDHHHHDHDHHRSRPVACARPLSDLDNAVLEHYDYPAVPTSSDKYPGDLGDGRFIAGAGGKKSGVAGISASAIAAAANASGAHV